MKLLLALGLALASNAWAEDQLLDDFGDPTAWKLSASDDVQAALRPAPGPHGSALCIDFDFGTVTGYVSLRRAMKLDFPARFEFTLGVSGDAPRNALQFKLVDASGDNVWAANRLEYHFAGDWHTERFRQNDIAFAWGPTADRQLRRTAALELVVASGSGAGKGSVCFDHLVLRPLPSPPSPDEPREFGDVTVRWPAGAGPSRYDLQFSDDGTAWRTVRHVERARGDVQHHLFVGAQARAVRVLADVAPASLELGTAANANAFFTHIAGQAPRGAYPRAYVGEQAYWTVFGVDGAREASLMGEDGAIEPLPGVGALEPFLVVDGRVLGWADAPHRPRPARRLPADADHPLAGRRLSSTSLPSATAARRARAMVRYTVRNHGPRTPSWRWRWLGGRSRSTRQRNSSPIAAARARSGRPGGTVAPCGPTARCASPVAAAEQRPSRARGGRGRLVDWLDEVTVRRPGRRPAARDPDGFANAVLRYDMRLAAGERRTSTSRCRHGRPLPGRIRRWPRASPCRRGWHAALDKVDLYGPGRSPTSRGRSRRPRPHPRQPQRRGPAAGRAGLRAIVDPRRRADLVGAAAARPGRRRPRLPALVRAVPVRATARCRAARPRAAPTRCRRTTATASSPSPSPSCVATRGDEATARALWPHVAAAIAHMDTLRASERTAANRSGERAAYYGLMPPSISHEGYSDKAAYSYWDDFWAYTGYRSAVELATGLGLAGDAARLAAQRDEFLGDLQASLPQAPSASASACCPARRTAATSIRLQAALPSAPAAFCGRCRSAWCRTPSTPTGAASRPAATTNRPAFGTATARTRRTSGATSARWSVSARAIGPSRP